MDLHTSPLAAISRRRITQFIAGAAAMPFYNEYAMAQEAERQTMRGRGAMPADAVRISSNENPLGPCQEGLEAMYKVAPLGGRYSPTGETQAFTKVVSELAGSSDPLHGATSAFTSPTRSW